MVPNIDGTIGQKKKKQNIQDMEHNMLFSSECYVWVLLIVQQPTNRDPASVMCGYCLSCSSQQTETQQVLCVGTAYRAAANKQRPSKCYVWVLLIVQQPTNRDPAKSLQENAITVFGRWLYDSLPKYLRDIERVKLKKSNLRSTNFKNSFLISPKGPTISPHQEEQHP